MLQGAGDEGVIRPRTALFTVQQAGINQDLEVVRHRGLAQVKRLGEVANTGLPGAGALDDGKQPQPVGIGQGFEHQGLALGIRCTEGRLVRRCTAGLVDGRLNGLQGIHVSIMHTD